MLKSASVHWHGIRQNGTNHADGVSFVTQCPIAQNHSFLYSFEARNQAGTFWYHSHYGTQQCDGLRGALIIYDPEDPLSYLYDVDDETTVITLADWYHVAAPVLSHIIGTDANSTLINGLGRYRGRPQSPLAVIGVEYGKRYRLRLVAMSCDPNFVFSIDNHTLTRYSAVLVANQPVDNYWLRALPSTPGLDFSNGQSYAILRYNGASIAEPTTNQTNSTMPLFESNLHAFINPGAPGIPEYGKADINLRMAVNITRGIFSVNGITYQPPTVPGVSVYVLEPNKVVELTMPAVVTGGPHPDHLHGASISGHQSTFDCSL
ncbi:Cupredoxin [Suillus spraguei]|nr:Cupredoxin [Suillus spraguei]